MGNESRNYLLLKPVSKSVSETNPFSALSMETDFHAKLAQHIDKVDEEATAIFWKSFLDFFKAGESEIEKLTEDSYLLFDNSQESFKDFVTKLKSCDRNKENDFVPPPAPARSYLSEIVVVVKGKDDIIFRD